jgi:hypothetical protein
MLILASFDWQFVYILGFTEVGMIDHMTIIFLIIWKLPYYYHNGCINIPTKIVHGDFSLCPSILTFWYFDSGPSNRCEVITLYVLNLHFSDG